MKFLKSHPFAVEAFFESSLVVTYAVPKNQLLKFIPECLELDTFKDEWGFVAVAMVQTKGLRPKGFPKFMGQDFFLIGYRAFVRFHNNAGKRLRGLYILKSETDKKFMQFFGNIFTHYQYSTTDIQKIRSGAEETLSSEHSNFKLTIDRGSHTTELPEGSPFATWKEARRYAGPLPFTFTYSKEDHNVLIIEGVRKNWEPVPIAIKHHDFEFLNNLGLNNAVLANAFEITNIPYYWKKGKLETWN
ncbi:MAG: DUF2071 domain-containing protein [Flavobacteriaceae bacterium]